MKSRTLSRSKLRRPAGPVICEAMEVRQMLAAQAPEFIAIADGTQTLSFGNTQRAVAYYDVSGIEDTGTPGGIFNDDPLFTVWAGYEQTANTNYEEISGLAVNPSNGDTYQLAFDSGTPGNVDSVGDTEGDYDLYRFDINKIYADFIANNRPRGIMYHPAVSSDGFDAIANYGSATPALDSGLGIHPNRSNIDGDTTNDFVFIDAIEKVGEVRRYGASGSTPFFDQQDLQFVDAETLLLAENTLGSGALGGNVGTGTGAGQDYSIRTIERISTTTGAAAPQAGDTGGYNGNTTESWESFAWTGDNFIGMDSGGTDLSEMDGMRYVERDGVRGAWVSERDGGGDDFQFFALDFSTRTATKQGIFALDEDPSANDNQGDVDFFDVDDQGTLIIGESSFSDTPQAEPSIQTVDITTYTGSVTFGTFSEEPVVAPTLDDDNQVTDGRFSVYERGQNRVYRFDIDASATTDDAGPGIGNPNQVVADIYVYDLDTNTLVYQELNAVNLFTLENRIRAFTLGDFATTGGSQTSQDGIVDASDIDAYYALIADPTVGGRFSSAVGQEMFDLTGDDLLTVGDPLGVGSVTGDMDYLIRRALGTDYGDLDLNNTIDGDDLFFANLGIESGGIGYASGDVNGDGVINGDDLFIINFQIDVNPNPIRI